MVEGAPPLVEMHPMRAIFMIPNSDPPMLKVVAQYVNKITSTRTLIVNIRIILVMS